LYNNWRRKMKNIFVNIKELNFEEATFEYKFNIKDKENMLQVVKLDSQNGVILRINNESSVKENKDGHSNDKGGHGEN
jgi:hypothetical protein